MTSLADFQPAGKRQRKRGKKEERREKKQQQRVRQQGNGSNSL